MSFNLTMLNFLKSAKKSSRRTADSEVFGRDAEGTEPASSSAVAEPTQEKSTVPKRNKRVRPKTYSFAVYIVVGLLLIEVVALFSIFHFRRVVINISTQAPPILAQNETALDPVAVEEAATTSSGGLDPLMPETILSKIKPSEDGPVSVMSEEQAPEKDAQQIAMAKEEAIRLQKEREAEVARKAAEEKERKIRAYIDQSNRFLREEDFANAKRMLKRALNLNREDPVTLRSLAMLAKAEGRPNESILYWRRIVSLGPEVGDIYALAKEEVAAAEAKAKLAAAEASRPEPGTNTRVPKFMIRGFEKQIGSDPAFADQMQLDFDVVLNGVTQDDLNNLEIEFFFYDYMPGKVVPAAGEIVVSPAGSDTEWLDNKKMHLTASYQLEENMAKNTNRRYHGYLFRIYHNKVLQDEQAEPVQLLDLVNPKY